MIWTQTEAELAAIWSARLEIDASTIESDQRLSREAWAPVAAALRSQATHLRVQLAEWAARKP